MTKYLTFNKIVKLKLKLFMQNLLGMYVILNKYFVEKLKSND